jgi:hypothetical protein
MLGCYNCQRETTEKEAQRGTAVINALAERLGEDFIETMTDYSSVETVHCRPSPEQTTAEGEVAYCAGCTLQLVFDGLRLGEVVHA